MKPSRIAAPECAVRAIGLTGIMLWLLVLMSAPVLCSDRLDEAVGAGVVGGKTAARARGNVTLPAGLTPGDVVRAVERDHEFALTGGAGAVPRARADEVRPPFQIGLGGCGFLQAELIQGNVSVASDGVNYLVVWDDNRNGTDRDVFGARVSAEGVLLDPGGIAISVRPRDQDNPCATFDGVNYLVVWEDSRGVSTDIYGARVGVDGAVLDTAGIVISGAVSAQWYPYAAFDGTNCLVVWSDYRVSGRSNIYGSRVTPGGAALDTAGIKISSASTVSATSPSLAFGGSNYLVTWRMGTTIYAGRVTVDGTVLDTTGITVRNANNALTHTSVASDGTDYLVVWRDLRNDSTDVYAARVGADGAVLDTAGIPISTAPGVQYNPVAVFDGVDYLVVWQDVRTGSNDIYASRVSANGVVLDPAGRVISEAPAGQNLPAVAFSGADYFVAWQDYRNGEWDIYGTRVDASISPLDTAGISISVVGTDLYDAATGFDGTNYLVVWTDESDGLWDLYGARVSADGGVLDAGAFPVSTAPDIQRAPAVAFDGTDYLVVWEDTRNGSRDIYGTRVSVGGEVLDTAGIAISTAPQDQRVPSIAFDRVGSACLVVWEDWRNSSWDVYGARVNPDGVVVDSSGIVICAAPGDQRDPAIVFGLADFYVVWEDARNGSWDIYGTRVSREGTVQDPAGRAVSTAVGYQYFPQLSFDGANYLVVWNDDRSGVALDVYGARVGITGVVQDPQGIAISTAPNHQLYPAPIFDGTNHLVVWEDGRNDFPDIYGARVSTAGVVLDADGLVVACFPGEDFSATAVRGPGSSALIAYSSYTQPQYRAFRVWGSIWSGPTAVVLASASAVGTGGRVTLSWELSERVPESSFTIERAESHTGQYSRRDVQVQQVSERSYSCVDDDVESGKTYWYMIVISGAQNDERYGPLEVTVGVVPVAWALHQNYPNPFNPSCTIRYEVKDSGRVKITVFDVSGRVVKTLVNAWREPGIYVVTWNGTDERKRNLVSGGYFYAIEAGGFRAVRKMVISR